MFSYWIILLFLFFFWIFSIIELILLVKFCNRYDNDQILGKNVYNSKLESSPRIGRGDRFFLHNWAKLINEQSSRICQMFKCFNINLTPLSYAPLFLTRVIFICFLWKTKRVRRITLKNYRYTRHKFREFL